MKKDYITIPLKEIRRRKLRSWLTLIGIIIGIAAVVSLITLGSGLKNAIEGQFAALGNDKLFVSPKGNTFSPGLSIDAVSINDDDLKVVERVQGVRRATGFATTTGEVEFNDISRYFFVWGQSTDPEDRELIGESQNYKIGVGRVMEKGDENKVVLGWEHSQDTLFEKAVELGDNIVVQGKKLTVIGFLEKIGSPPDDRSVSIAIDTYEDLFETKGELGLLIVQTEPGEDIDVVADRVQKDLRKARGLAEGKEDFNVETPRQLGAAFTTILDILQVVLLGIAGISLLVGGINVMNTMYTSVLERTKQIGVMKALGARNRHILTLFVVESGLYGLGGGIIGAIIGIGFAKTVELLMQTFVGPAFLSISIDTSLVLGTLTFSFVVGCLSGIAPARQASKMSPVDALRYE